MSDDEGGMRTAISRCSSGARTDDEEDEEEDDGAEGDGEGEDEQSQEDEGGSPKLSASSPDDEALVRNFVVHTCMMHRGSAS